MIHDFAIYESYLFANKLMLHPREISYFLEISGRTICLYMQGLRWYGFEGFGRTRQFLEEGSQTHQLLTI